MKQLYNPFFSIFLIIFLNLNKSYVISFIVLPFNYINKKTNESVPLENSSKEYFESLINNTVFTKIKIENKVINFHLSTERHTIYISEKSFDQKMKDGNNLYSLEYIGISEAQFRNSNFSFLLNNTNDIIVDNISYFMVKKLYINPNNYSKLSSHITENNEIGFNIYKGNPYETVEIGDDDVEDFYEDIFDFDDNKTSEYKDEDKNKLLKNGGFKIEEYTNLITQLKKKDVISSYTFLIKYNNKEDEKGEIIIGGYPHEYDPSHYSENYFIYDYVPIQSKGQPNNWHTILDKISLGNENIVDDKNHSYYKHVVFSLDFGFISASYTFKDYFYKNFFINYKDLCRNETVNNYLCFSCPKEVIKNFPKLSFHLSKKYNTQMNSSKIEFDYNDLFIQSKINSNLYYFQIIFVEISNKWVLGRPLFKKYPFIFDQDSKKFGFYLETGKYDISNNKNKSKNIPWSLIIIIILSVCVIILSFTLYKALPLIFKRKKKANELDDDFIYETKENKNEENEEKKLFEDKLIN